MKWTEIVSLGISGSAAIFTLIIFLIRKKLERNQIINELVKEYSTTIMGIAVERLWKLFKKECNNDEKILIEKYIEIKQRDDLKNVSGDKKDYFLHFQRRRVSKFYQRMAYYYNAKVLKKKDINSNWKKGDLRIIPKIIFPIETEAMSRLNVKEGTPQSEIDENIWNTKIDFLYMLEFYRAFEDC